MPEEASGTSFHFWLMKCPTEISTLVDFTCGGSTLSGMYNHDYCIIDSPLTIGVLSHQDFYAKLQDHIISRVCFPGMADDGTTYPSADCAQVSALCCAFFIFRAHTLYRYGYPVAESSTTR